MSIPAMTPSAFTPAFGFATLRCSPSRVCRPARPARLVSRSTGTSPAGTGHPRYDKLARSYRAGVLLCAVLAWLDASRDTP